MKLGEIESHVHSAFQWIKTSFELLFSGNWRELTIGQAIFILIVLLGYFHLISTFLNWVFNLKISMEVVSAVLIFNCLLIMIYMNFF